MKKINEHTLYEDLLDEFEEIAMKENNMELKKAVEEQRKSDLTGSILPDIAEESIIEQEDVGISGMFIDALNDCWSAIDNYNSIIVTLDELDRHEFDDTLQTLLEERNKEVGALQAIVELLNGSGKEIETGKSEAEDSIAFDTVEESQSKRKSYSQLNESMKITLKEDWNVNGTLIDWEPRTLVDKAFENRYATNTIREYGNMKLYINVDPGFLFGTRKEDSGIWLSIVEIDENNNQDRIYLEKASNEDEAEQMLLDWKEEYIG